MGSGCRAGGGEPILQRGWGADPTDGAGAGPWGDFWPEVMVLDRGHLRMGSAKAAAQDILPLDEQRRAQNPSGCQRGEALE